MEDIPEVNYSFVLNPKDFAYYFENKFLYPISWKQNKNYYTILGLSIECSQEEINKAYYKEARKWHPDKWSGSDEHKKDMAKKRFQALANAFETLKNPDLRRQYDQRTSSNHFTNPDSMTEQQALYIFSKFACHWLHTKMNDGENLYGFLSSVSLSAIVSVVSAEGKALTVGILLGMCLHEPNGFDKAIRNLEDEEKSSLLRAIYILLNKEL